MLASTSKVAVTVDTDVSLTHSRRAISIDSMPLLIHNYSHHQPTTLTLPSPSSPSTPLVPDYKTVDSSKVLQCLASHKFQQTRNVLAGRSGARPTTNSTSDRPIIILMTFLDRRSWRMSARLYFDNQEIISQLFKLRNYWNTRFLVIFLMNECNCLLFWRIDSDFRQRQDVSS